MRLLITAMVLWAGTAFAQESAVPIPQSFALGTAPIATAPSGVERTQSINGTVYTVISPIFLGGTNGTQSYMRFTNRSANTDLTTVTVVGSPSGSNYGTVNVQVPAYASPQYSVTQILSALNVPASLNNGDTGVSLYLQDTDSNSGFQHVIFNGANAFFEDLSMCVWNSGVDYSALDAWVFNADTTTLSAFPAIIYLNNFSSVAQTYLVDLYEAQFGGYKGTISITASPNTIYSIPFSWFESEADWTPSGTEEQANLHFRIASGPFGAVVGQAIYNQSLNAYINMTQSCAIYQVPKN